SHPKSIHKILDLQLIGTGNSYSTYLMQTKHSEPELVMSYEYKHYTITFNYAVLHEKSCCFIRFPFHITESEGSFFAKIIAPYHRTSVRFIACDPVNNIISK